MYSRPFYITKNEWNNTFSFKKRQNKKIYVTSLKKINSFDEIKLGKEIVFEDFDENWVLRSCKWLENFYEMDFWKIKNPPSPLYQGEKVNYKKLYLFDNHNHAYFFWYKAKVDWIIWDNSVLIHIDEHSDLRDPWVYLQKNDLNNLEKIFDYTNHTLNVWNYIIPAKKDKIIWEIIQIRSEVELLVFSKKLKNQNFFPVISNEVEKSFKESNNNLITNNDTNKEQISPLQSKWQSSIILNLDLDFFEPNLDYIDYNLKKEVIIELTKKASLITVATSPFFIDQDLALKVFKDLFKK